MRLRLISQESAKQNRVRMISSLFFVFFCMAARASAAEEGANSAAQTADSIFKWINFAIVIGILVWLFAKKLPPWFRRNAESISSAITKATAAKEEAERQVREAEAKLAHLEQEIVTLHAAAQREAAAEAEHIRTLTQSDTKKVGIAAQAEIEAAERAARLELKALAASLAVDGAESLLAKQLTPAAQESLVDTFVKSLEGRPN
jgi:F-type H+-transporting ATPase subunit b